jgi:hypothetical protein
MAEGMSVGVIEDGQWPSQHPMKTDTRIIIGLLYRTTIGRPYLFARLQNASLGLAHASYSFDSIRLHGEAAYLASTQYTIKNQPYIPSENSKWRN